MPSTADRRARASGSRASRRAIPTWLCAARAATAATVGSMPSRDTSSAATASTGGTRSATERLRERMVTRTSCGLGAQSTQTVRPAGSSMALRSELPLVSFSRSASSMMMTR